MIELLKNRRLHLACIALAGLFGIWRIVTTLSPTLAQQACANRLFIDSVTGKTFHAAIHVGQTMPVASPFTGRKTGYPVAWSWWSRNGAPLHSPEPVLMNFWLGLNGPTFAPLSGRLVYPMETKPYPGQPPPPTRREYEQYLRSRDAGN